MPAEKIRVLIVDDVAETRESIRRMLQFDTQIEVIGSVSSGREAIDFSIAQKPDVVLMDINMADVDGISATEAIRRRVPFTQVIILSVQSDPNYMRRAMLAGARDFLAKPPMIDELTNAIRLAGNVAFEEKAKGTGPFQSGVPAIGPGLNGSSKDGKVIVAYSPKGGAGSTTVAVNLAVALHSSDNPTCLVDGSLQYGDAAVFLNEQGKNSLLDLATRVDDLDKDYVQSIALVHKSTGMNLLTCPPKPEFAEQVTGESFDKMLQFLRQLYDYVVVDTSSYLTDAVLAAMDQADLIVLLATQEIASIKSTSLFINLMDATSMSRSKLLFAMNRFDKRITITPEKVGESLRQEVKAVIPADERTVSTSINRGVPFVIDSKNTPVAKAVLAMAEDICNRLTTEQTAAPDMAKK